MNTNTTLFAVIVTGEYFAHYIGPCTPEIKGLYHDDDDAIKAAEGYAKFDLTLHNEYLKPETDLKYEYVSTTDGRYDAEGNDIEQKNWERLEAGNCHWDIAYKVTLKDRFRTLSYTVCKWVDFEY